MPILPGNEDVSEYRHHGLEARATKFSQPNALPGEMGMPRIKRVGIGMGGRWGFWGLGGHGRLPLRVVGGIGGQGAGRGWGAGAAAGGEVVRCDGHGGRAARRRAGKCAPLLYG